MADLVLARSIPECVGFLRRSSRSDLIGVVGGLLVLPFMLFVYNPSSSNSLTPALAAFLLLLGLSFGGAFLAASRANISVIPLHCVIPSGARMGARLGCVTFLVGGGMALLASVIRQLMLGIAPGDYEWSVPTLATTAGIFFTILPTIAVGSLGAVWRFGLPSVLAERLRRKSHPQDRPRQPLGVAIWASVATFILCLGSPAILVVRAKRSPVEAVAAEPAKGQPFEHRVPVDFANAEAGRWTIKEQRPLEGLLSGASAAISKDGKYLAYIRDNGTRVAVHDLSSDTEWRRFSVYPSAKALAWSIDGKRIFITSASKIDPFWILYPEERDAKYLRLTSTVNADRLNWHKENEIEFFSGATRVAILDLHLFKLQLPSAEYDDSGGKIVTDPFPSTSRCRVEVSPCLEAAESPLAMERNGWGFRSKPGLFVIDQQSNQRVPLVTENLGFGTDFLVTSDCSRIISISPKGAWISYVTLKEKPDGGVLKGSFPETPETLLKDIGSKNRLAAFVYAPRKSSPDQKDSDADFSRVRCLAFFESHEGLDATFHIAESYRPIQPGDVIGRWHFWVKGCPVAIAGRGIEDWSFPITEVPLAGDQKAFPSRAWEYPKFQQSSAGFTLINYGPKPITERVDSVYRLPSSKGPSPSSAESNKPELQRDPSGAAADQGKPVPEVSTKSKVEEFVRAHHAKVGKYDLEGFVADYASSVERYGTKGVTPEAIRREQGNYMPRYEQLSEVIYGAVLLKETDAGWEASYTIRSFAVVKRDGSVSDRMVSLNLGLVEKPDGTFEIVREQVSSVK